MEKSITIYIIIFFISFILFFAGVIALYLQYRNKQRFADKEKKLLKQQHQQELINAEFEIQQQTMQDIGREIHDNVGQKLTLASLYTQQLHFENRYPLIHDNITGIGNLINESLNELRALSKSLTNLQIESMPLKELLEMEMHKISAAGGYHCEISVRSKLGYSTFFKTIIFRIVQEFFQNSIKHAKATRLVLRFNHQSNGAHLFVSDNGCGFNRDAVNDFDGLGLNGMRKRALLVGGKLNFQSAIGAGTSLALFVPEEKIYE